MTCKHCDKEATEGMYCLPCYNEVCNELITRLKDPMRIKIARLETDLKLAQEHMESRRMLTYSSN